MTPDRLLRTAIIPALSELAALDIPDSLPARRQVLCIALQETGLRHRRQVTSTGHELGPAMSFWQFERGGGCIEVFHSHVINDRMRRICADFNVEPNAAALWTAMQYHDVVAACAARLLVYTRPEPLPTTAADGWAQYLKTWRPGKPHPSTWAGHWATADAVVKGEMK
ncbi:MAG: hypothetical protein V4857_14230 [Pseudomonadota bacterium]